MKKVVVVKSGPYKGCWEWTGYTNAKGYPQFWFIDRMHWAQRVSKQTFTGQFKPGNEGGHECINPKCVNPDHIEEQTKSDNSGKYHVNDRRKAPPLPKPKRSDDDCDVPF